MEIYWDCMVLSKPETLKNSPFWNWIRIQKTYTSRSKMPCWHITNWKGNLPIVIQPNVSHPYPYSDPPDGFFLTPGKVPQQVSAFLRIKFWTPSKSEINDFKVNRKVPNWSPFKQISASNEKLVIKELIKICQKSLAKFPQRIQVVFTDLADRFSGRRRDAEKELEGEGMDGSECQIGRKTSVSIHIRSPSQ